MRARNKPAQSGRAPVAANSGAMRRAFYCCAIAAAVALMPYSSPTVYAQQGSEMLPSDAGCAEVPAPCSSLSNQSDVQNSYDGIDAPGNAGTVHQTGTTRVTNWSTQSS